MHNTHTHAHPHKFSHSTEPFLKPGLIFVWIIGLCAYRLHHIGRLKPYYQPIEWGKGVFDKHTESRAHKPVSQRHTQHLFNMQQKHTFWSWNAPRHGSELRGLSRARQKLEAGSASFISKAAVIIVFFLPSPLGKVNKYCYENATDYGWRQPYLFSFAPIWM